MTACGMAEICLANGLAGRTGSMPWNVALSSVSTTPGRVSSRAHPGAYIDGSDNTGRGPTAVEYLISLSAIAEDDADADSSWSRCRRVLGPTRGAEVTA